MDSDGREAELRSCAGTRSVPQILTIWPEMMIQAPQVSSCRAGMCRMQDADQTQAGGAFAGQSSSDRRNSRQREKRQHFVSLRVPARLRPNYGCSQGGAPTASMLQWKDSQFVSKAG